MQDSIEITVNGPEEALRVGELLGEMLKPGDIVALTGELGAGKTVIVKGIARGLGIEEEPTSPTFVIMNVYEGKNVLYHFDLYRVSGVEELEGLGYRDFFYDNGVVVVEWADRAREIFPPSAIRVEIAIPEGDAPRGNKGIITRRNIRITGDRDWLSLFRSTVERALPT